MRWAWRKGVGASLAKVWAGKESAWAEGSDEVVLELVVGFGVEVVLTAIVQSS